MNRAEVLRNLSKFLINYKNQYSIKNIGIFGSFAKGENTEESDLDIVIKTDNANLFELVHLKEDLENFFKVRVDLVRYRQRMNPFLKKHIDEEAIYVS